MLTDIKKLKFYETIIGTLGNTPLVRLNKITRGYRTLSGLRAKASHGHKTTFCLACCAYGCACKSEPQQVEDEGPIEVADDDDEAEETSPGV